MTTLWHDFFMHKCLTEVLCKKGHRVSCTLFFKDGIDNVPPVRLIQFEHDK